MIVILIIIDLIEISLDKYQVHWVKINMGKEQTLLDLFPEQQKEMLLNQAKVKRYNAGSTLFEKGDRAEYLYVVKRGQVKLVRLMPSGDEKIFKVFLANGVIAEMAMFMPEQSYPMTAIAEVDSDIIMIKKPELLEQISFSPALAIEIMGFMSERISNLMNTIDALTQVNAEQRFIMFLAQLKQNQKRERALIQLPFSKKVLANQICVKPETLSRLLKKLKDKQLLIERGNCIELPDIKKLCESAELLPDIFDEQYRVA